MTPLPPNADELVSAYLDGEAAPDEIALVESSPELLEHAESMRALVAPLNEPVASPPAKEAHLSAALDLFDDLFATADTAAEDAAPPHLTAVPAAAATTASMAATAQPAASSPPPVVADNVASFEEARERRQRRVSPTVIAAAVAAVALLLFAVFSAGTANDDVATGASDAVQSTAADSASDDASDAAMDDEAMDEAAMDDEEDAMDDDETRVAGGMSDAEAPQAAAPVEAEVEAMDEEDAMDDEEAMAEESAEDLMADDDAAADGDAGATASEDRDGNGAFRADGEIKVDSRDLYVFGDVPDAPTLEQQLENVPLDELRFRAQLDLEGLFPRCRFELDELPDDGASLIGEGLVDQLPVEVHLVETDQERRIYVVAADACRVVFDFALGR